MIAAASWGKITVLVCAITIAATSYGVSYAANVADEDLKNVSTAAACQKEKKLCLVPVFSKPNEQLKALTPPPLASGKVRTVNYSVETRGALKSNLAEFERQANETLNSPLGWSRLGVAFKKVATGGEFTLVLSQASEVPGFSSGCDSTYSCNVGRFVIINEDRWLGATDAWNSGGGSLRDYRHMVINHETGHWLGQGHENCPGAGQPAPVMQQQSMSLQGCTFNPWPIQSELYAPTLGI